MVNLPNPYASKHYYLLGVVPVLLVLVALLFIPSIPKGIDLRGGTLITVQSSTAVNTAALQSTLSKYSASVQITQISTPTGTGVEIQLENRDKFDSAEAKLADITALDTQLSNLQTSGSTDPAVVSQENTITSQILAESNQVLSLVGSSQVAVGDAHAAVKLAQDQYSITNQLYEDKIRAAVQSAAPGASISVQQVGSSLSRYFLAQAQNIVLYAFILSAVAIFIVFRSVGPSIAVIFGAMADIIITAGVMGLLGIPLTLASIATLLMLIGFSLDTDVMLTIRVLQRKEGTPAERAAHALVTGGMMNLTTVGAFGVLFVVGTLLQVPTYQQIGEIAVIGGLVDFIATWCFNASLVLYFAKKAAGPHEAAAA